MLRLTSVTKRYAGKTALSNVSLHVEKGEILGLLGRNGAGKSTMMNLITGYLPASEGRVEVNGIDMEEEPGRAKRHIGYLPEKPPLYDTMTAQEYLHFVGKIKGISGKLLAERVKDVCDRVGIPGMRGRLIRNLSKGYRQRVGIAQAMLGDPDLLILDEPTIGLDPAQIVEIRGTIKKFGQNRTVMISSHILPEIAEICQRVVIIQDGKLLGDYKMSEFGGGQNTARLHVRVTCAREELASVLHTLPGVVNAGFLGVLEPGTSDWEVEYERQSGARESLFDVVVNNGWRLLMSSPVEQSIEDVFLRLTNENGQTMNAVKDRPV